MLKRLFGTAMQRVVVPLGAAVGRAGVSPNMVTLAGFVVTLLAAAAIAQGYLLAGGLILVAGALFDMLDGAVARATGGGSSAGAFLDSTLDRLSDAAVFAGLVWYFIAGVAADADLVGAGLALTCLVLSLMVSYVRARAEGLGFTCQVGIAERPERIALVVAGLVLGLIIPALALLAAASAVTVLQRFVHVWRQAAIGSQG